MLVGLMNELEIFRISEEIKDRFSTIFKDSPEFSCSPEAVGEGGNITAKVVNICNDIMKKDGARKSIMYLIDVIGYYVMLCYDIQNLNEELVNKLKEFTKND